jgi:uncharacterized delta-60 repeat protein
MGRAGSLDRSFGGDGRVVTAFPRDRARTYPNYALPFEFAPGRIAMARAPGGKLVVASSKAIVRYLANGRRDPAFGGNGSVPIAVPAGFRFQLADVAVDSEGRVVVAGTTKATNGIGLEGEPNEIPGPLPSIATVRRYASDGAADASFGREGVIHSFFGAPPATFKGGAFPEPSAALLGLAVDGQDRPIVTGSAVVEVGRCGGSEIRYERSQGFVARMSAADGRPDPSFAGGAVVAIDGTSWLSAPTPADTALFAVGADVEPCKKEAGDQPSIVTAIGDTSLVSSFSEGGFWSEPFLRVSDVAAAPGGKIVLLARTLELSHGEWIESAGKAIRLLPDGARDQSFGRDGESQLRLPRHSSIGALAVDGRGRVLLAGTVGHRKRGAKRPQLAFLLMRTAANGRADRRFGRRGRVTTRFSHANVRATGVLLARGGRIVVGGKLSGASGGNAFALARYRGRP